MYKAFTPLNVFIILVLLILSSVIHLMYGSCQTSKYHYLCQAYWLPNKLPKWMIQEKIVFLKEANVIMSKGNSKRWRIWDKNGVLAHEWITEIINGKEVSKFVFWHSNGIKSSEGESRGGEFNGRISSWDEDGIKISEREYKNGRLNGKSLGWYKSGIKSEEIEYKDGKENGKAIEWDEDGKKIKDEEWQDGVMLKDYLSQVQ